MKKSILSIIGIIFCLLIFSCGDDNEVSPTSNNTCNDGFTYFEGEGGGTIEMELDGIKWASCGAVAENTSVAFAISGAKNEGEPSSNSLDNGQIFNLFIYNYTSIGVYKFDSALINYQEIQGTVFNPVINEFYSSDLIEPTSGDFVEIESINNGFVKGTMNVHVKDANTDNLVLMTATFNVKMK